MVIVATNYYLVLKYQTLLFLDKVCTFCKSDFVIILYQKKEFYMSAKARLVAEVDPDLKKKILIHCLQNGTSIRHLITWLITNHLKDKKNGKTGR